LYFTIMGGDGFEGKQSSPTSCRFVEFAIFRPALRAFRTRLRFGDETYIRFRQRRRFDELRRIDIMREFPSMLPILINGYTQRILTLVFLRNSSYEFRDRRPTTTHNMVVRYFIIMTVKNFDSPNECLVLTATQKNHAESPRMNHVLSANSKPAGGNILDLRVIDRETTY